MLNPNQQRQLRTFYAHILADKHCLVCAQPLSPNFPCLFACSQQCYDTWNFRADNDPGLIQPSPEVE